MLAVTLVLAVLIGVALGLLGGGGSILTVPILVYAAGMGPKEAIAASLLVVGVTSGVAAVSHARAGRVRWRTGLVFGAAGMAGAYAGGRLAEFIPGTVLLVAFGLMMLATAAAMIRGRRTAEPAERREMPVLKVVLEGVVVGLVTGLVGAGGGFLIVPALVLLGGLPMHVAVGTSLVVISMKSFAGLAGYLASVQVDWGLAWAVTGAAVVGSLLGNLLAGRIPQQTLRKGFGWFVVVMAVFVLGQQVPWGGLVLPVGAWVAGAAAVLAVGLGGWLWWRRRHEDHQGPGGDPAPQQLDGDQPAQDQPPASPEDATAVLQRHRRQAVAALERSTGGEPLCSVDGDASSRKRHEGAVAALTEVARHHEANPGAGVRTSASRVRESWSDRLADHRGPHWRAYREGGHDALSALLADTTPTETPVQEGTT